MKPFIPIPRALILALLAAQVVPLAALAEEASLAPPRHVDSPLPEHAVTNRAFQGIPSMAVAPRGRHWAVWYAGVTPGEDHNNYVVLSTSGDGGATWKEVLIVDPDGSGSVRAFDPELWTSPDGRLFVFWAQMDRGRPDAQLGVWSIETRQADDEQPKWTRPRRISDGVMMCKPLTLTTGELVLPVSKWREHDHSAQMMVSTDRGETWTLRGGCNVPVDARQFDEHMFIERRDGSLWLLVRTKYGIGESVSTDRGRTWPELKPSAISHTSSRFFIRRLASDNLLLVKHGPLDTRSARSHLTAYISTDDGLTWSGGLMLDERAGVSYPDGQQTLDGLIRVIYDFSRTGDRNVLMATFREEDAAAGRVVSDAVQLRQLVSKATGGREKAKSTSSQAAPKSAPAKKVEPSDAPPGKSYIYKHSAGQPRELEIYFPPNHVAATAKVPGLILFHGGGWSGGSLSQFRTACHYFASRGLVAATVDYQMLTSPDAKNLPPKETRKRVCITDAKSSIRWIKQHALELGIDPKRIIIGGGSAGGHISVLATMNPGLNDPADPEDFDTSVVAYLLFNPAFALDDHKDAEVDVLMHIKPSFAPAIVFFGTQDRWQDGWDILHEKLKNLRNLTTDLQIAESQKHGFFNNDPWRTVTLIAADRFLAKQHLLQGEPTLMPPATGEKLTSSPETSPH